MNSTFGKFIREKRLEQNLTLREFCKTTGYDIGYISRLENDLFLPPEDEEKLEKLANILNIKRNTTAWNQYYDLATIARRQLPKDIDSKVLNYLPAFFRKASKKEVKKEDVEKLIGLIKGTK